MYVATIALQLRPPPPGSGAGAGEASPSPFNYHEEFAKRIVFYYQMSSKCKIVNTKLTVTIKSIINQS